MRTIVGNSTKKTKDKKTERIVNLDANLFAVPTNVSQYGAGGFDVKELETAKHFASEAEKSAKEAASSAEKAEDFYDLTLEAALEVQNNTDDSFNYLEEIKKISVKIDGQEAGIDESEKQVILHATAAENAAQIASDSAASARASEANSAASASSANNSAVASKESEQNSKISELSAIDSAVKANQTLAQTNAVYDKTIDDVSQAVQSYLKDKGGFDPNAGLPTPDSWVDIFGVRKNLSCLWTADKGGTLEGIPFNEGDVLLYNAILDRYGRFSGQLVTGGGGGGATEFFNDIKLAADKRLVGTDSRGSVVELIKLTNDIVEAGDKTKVIHLLAKDVNSAFVCVANAASGFDNYEIYHEGNKPTASDVGAHSKAEADAKFVDVTGDTMSGLLNTTNTIQIKSKEVYHPGNKPPASDIDAVSLTKSEDITGRKRFTQNPIIENTDPALSIKESDTDTEVLFKVDAKTLTIGTPATKLVDVNFNNNSVSLSTPKSKTAQGSTADALVRKDYTDAELAKKVDKTGGSIGGDLIVTGKVTVEGTGSIFKDINTTGQLRENSIRVYSPANKPSAVDVGALPISGGSVGGALNVVGNLSTDGLLTEKGQRVYSPNNKPTPAALGAVAKVGDQMTGALSISTSGATPLTLVRSGSSTANLNIRFNSGTADNYLGINAKGSLRFGTVADLDSHGNRIYHEGFKPTAADVGAIGIDNVYNKTQADDRFWQRTETVNRSFSTDALNVFSSNAESFKNDGSFRSYIAGTNTTGYPSTYGSGFYQGRMSGVNHQGWSLYNESTTNNLYHGRQHTDGTGFTWNKIYHEGFKPTPADINVYTKAEVDAKDNLKLNLTGGTITGVLSATSLRVDSPTEDNLNAIRYKAGNYTNTLVIRTSSGDPMVGSIKSDGTWSSYLAPRANGTIEYHSGGTTKNVYHTGFKPSATDVGALPLVGGTMSGGVIFTSAPVYTSATSHIFHNGNGTTGNPINIRSMRESGGATWLWEKIANGSLYYSTGVNGSSVSKIRIDASGGQFYAGNGSQRVYHQGDFNFSADAAVNQLAQRTSTGALKATAFSVPGDFRTIYSPAGGQFSADGAQTGSLQITLPYWKTAVMIKIHVSVYNYVSDTSFDAIISGYDYTDSKWHECSAVITGASGTTNHPVYFGHNGSKPCIWIGSVGTKWAHPKISITKVEAGYTGGGNYEWSSGWAVSLATALGTTSRTISDTVIKPGTAGLTADEQPTANTLVKRNIYGEIAAKGRVLIASSNDSDVGPGTAFLDFVSSAGTSYAQFGDTTNSQDLVMLAKGGRISFKSDSQFHFLSVTGNAQHVYTGGVLASNAYADGSKVPTNGIFAKGDIATGGMLRAYGNSASYMAAKFENAGAGWSYFEINAAGNPAHIAVNSTAIEGGAAGSLHLRPKGTAQGGLILQPNSNMMHQTTHGWVKIGSLNSGHMHFQTDRPSYHFDKVVRVAGDILAGPGYDKKVYHEGFKPTAADVGAHEVKPWIANPGMDANDSGNYTAFTYAQNAPHSGPLVSMGVNRYTMQFNSTYTGAQPLSFRTHNGDSATWNGWQTIYHTGNKPSPADLGAMSIGGGTMTGNLHASTGGFYPNADNASQLGNSGWRWNTGFIVNLNTDYAVVNGGLTIAQTGGIGNGLSLYGSSTAADPDYGMMFAQVKTFGGHGGVGGDWATYFNISGAANRGWIFRNKGTKLSASISCDGAVYASSLNVNNIRTGDATNTSWWRTEGDGGWFNATYGGGIHQTNSTWVNVYGGKKFYVANTSFDSIQVGGGILLANGSLDNTGCGLTGVYDATRFQGVFAMGHQYKLPQNGVGGGTLYGIAWTHSNNPSAEARRVSGHQMVLMDNGITRVAAGTGGIWANGTISCNGNMNAGGIVNAVAAGGSWGHGNSSGFTVSNASSNGSAYNLVGVPAGARIQALGGTGGTVRIYPNNGSTHYLDISNSGIQTAAISASGRITSSSGFSGNGDGLTNLNLSNASKSIIFNSTGATNTTIDVTYGQIAGKMISVYGYAQDYQQCQMVYVPAASELASQSNTRLIIPMYGTAYLDVDPRSTSNKIKVPSSFGLLKIIVH